MILRLYRVKEGWTKKDALPPLVCHPGAKSFSRHQILERMPEHKTYVEPFFGGGSVFFGKAPSEKEVINDKDKGLMGFYRRLDCKKLKRCVRNMVALGKNPEKIRPHWRRRANKLAAGSSDSCDVWIGKTYGYGCKSAKPSYAPSKAPTHPGSVKIERSCDKHKERLKGATKLSTDYQTVMKKYDSKSTFFYLDPPWLGDTNQKANASMYRGEDTTSPESVCAFLRRIKGKFILHYDDNPRIRRACKGFKIERVPWPSSMAGRGIEKKTALLISNFKRERKRRS